MHPRVTQSRQAISQLCDQLAVARLDLFGSASQGKLDVGDFDFFVELLPSEQASQARRYVALAEGLEALLGKPVDLVTPRSVRNPFFARALEQQRVAVYERA
jgi:uncharacterized protein